MKTKTRLWRYIYHDMEIPRPKEHDIEIPRPKSRDNIEIRGLKHHVIEKRRKLSHGMVIPKLFFFQRAKSHDIEIPRLKNHDVEISRLKTTASSFCAILTLMPPDSVP